MMSRIEIQYSSRREAVIDNYWLEYVKYVSYPDTISEEGFWSWFFSFKYDYDSGETLDDHMPSRRMKQITHHHVVPPRDDKNGTDGKEWMPEPNCTIFGHSHKLKDCPYVKREAN